MMGVVRVWGAYEKGEGWRVVRGVTVRALGFKVVVVNYRGGAGRRLE